MRSRRRSTPTIASTPAKPQTDSSVVGPHGRSIGSSPKKRGCSSSTADGKSEYGGMIVSRGAAHLREPLRAQHRLGERDEERRRRSAAHARPRRRSRPSDASSRLLDQRRRHSPYAAAIKPDVIDRLRMAAEHRRRRTSASRPRNRRPRDAVRAADRSPAARPAETPPPAAIGNCSQVSHPRREPERDRGQDAGQRRVARAAEEDTSAPARAAASSRTRRSSRGRAAAAA